MIASNDEKLNQAQAVKNRVIILDPKRWIVLAVFSMITLLSAFNWIEYNIVQDAIIFYYNESLPDNEAQQIDAVNWFSMVYMLCYIPLIFPTMFLLDRKGLKLSCTLGILLTFIGSSVKCAAVRRDLFLVAMLAQTICAIAQSFTLGIPARVSALWFGHKEIGLATSIGVFGNQLGTAIGFVVPPLLIKKSDPIDIIERNFYILFIAVAAICGLTLIFCLIFVKDQPKEAPSIAQWEIRNTHSISQNEESDFKKYKDSVIQLLKNYNFILVLISYGINTGSYYAIGTLLNLIISQYYADENENIGLIGLILVVSGLIGSIICGFILDRVKAFKLVTFLVYLGTFLSMVLFTFTLNINIWIIFGTSFMLGFFMTGYLPVGFELASEITYPICEGTSCGLLNTSAQIFGLIFTYSQGRIIYTYGPLAGNIFILVFLFIGTIVTGFVKADFRRQNSLKMCNMADSKINDKLNLVSPINSVYDADGSEWTKF